MDTQYVAVQFRIYDVGCEIRLENQVPAVPSFPPPNHGVHPGFIALHIFRMRPYRDFSSVFKKETGMSFVTYLTNVRMNEAQRLLDTTDEKSYIIAGLVGYEEPNYFSYVFKKHFGISPSKYRQ